MEENLLQSVSLFCNWKIDFFPIDFSNLCIISIFDIFFDLCILYQEYGEVVL